MRVIAIGGGGGGGNGHTSGGAGGYATCATLHVRSGDNIPVIVGAGGKGAIALYGSAIDTNQMVGCTAGKASSFGISRLVAGGGGACATWDAIPASNSGGTGSGAPYHQALGTNMFAGAGGINGSNGGSSSYGNMGGKGQGTDYSKCLKMAKNNILSAGAGGAAGKVACDWSDCNAAGGGGGGVLINGEGPSISTGEYHKFFAKLIESLSF